MDLSRIEWRKASASANGGGNCVEVGNAGDSVAVRDSKDPDGHTLVVIRAEWPRFLWRAQAGGFDLA